MQDLKTAQFLPQPTIQDRTFQFVFWKNRWQTTQVPFEINQPLAQHTSQPTVLNYIEYDEIVFLWQIIQIGQFARPIHLLSECQIHMKCTIKILFKSNYKKKITNLLACVQQLNWHFSECIHNTIIRKISFFSQLRQVIKLATTIHSLLV